MIVEALESYYRHRAIEANQRPQRWQRASSMGRCPRQLGYVKLGIQGDPLQPRRWSILEDGDLYDIGLKRDLIQSLGPKVISLDGLGINSCWIEGVEITFTPDFAFQTEDDRIALGEIKSMSNFGFERALKGEIDSAYLAQAWTYHFGTSFDPIVFVCVRKETRHICEVVFDSTCKEKVVTQRYGGDPLELAKDDPMLIAEIRSPFDDSVEQQVRETVRSVNACDGLSALPMGVRTIERELIKVQGKAKAEEQKAHYGEPVEQNGSWYSFATGRKILKFPCSYCQFLKNCFPNVQLEIQKEAPIWVVD